MLLDHNFPRLSIDPDEFAHALAGGALDECLRLFRNEPAGPETAGLYCRLAEALFHAGRADDAIDCARRAVALAPGDDEVAHFCAWLFSNCSLHGEAAAAYEGLVDRYPAWVEGLRHLSGSLAASGKRETACDIIGGFRYDRVLSLGVAERLRQAQRRKPVSAVVHNRRDLLTRGISMVCSDV